MTFTKLSQQSISWDFRRQEMKFEPKKVKDSIQGKVIVAGSVNAGKTCLIERFVRNVYVGDDPSHSPTVGCDCLQKSVTVDSTSVYLFLYDTAGQERYADMSGNYYRPADVCLLVFDLSDETSFEKVQWWREKVRNA